MSWQLYLNLNVCCLSNQLQMDSLSRDIQPVETALANMVDLIKSLDKGKNIEKKDLATVLEELKSTYCEVTSLFLCVLTQVVRLSVEPKLLL